MKNKEISFQNLEFLYNKKLKIMKIDDEFMPMSDEQFELTWRSIQETELIRISLLKK